MKYLPAQGASLAIPIGTRKLIPDQLFAIDYGGSFRSFVLEVDRGTEPYRSEAARKSLEGMLASYADLWSRDAARTHYGLKSPLLIMMVFTSLTRAARCLEVITETVPKLAPYVLVQTVCGGFPIFSPIDKSVSGEWRRSGLEGVEVL